MRIVVVGQPKTGNVWVKYLMANTFKLEQLEEVPSSSPEALQHFVAGGWFKDNAIFHDHFAPEEPFLSALAPTHCRFITPLRSPYDTFVSLYYFAQNHRGAFEGTDSSLSVLIGKPIDHPDVLDFIRYEYVNHLGLAQAWAHSGKAIVTRYEHLHSDPVHEVARVAAQLGSTTQRGVRSAIRASSARTLRRGGGYWRVHIRSATVGDWRNHLSEVHLQILRTFHADRIRSLGYTVW